MKWRLAELGRDEGLGGPDAQDEGGIGGDSGEPEEEQGLGAAPVGAKAGHEVSAGHAFKPDDTPPEPPAKLSRGGFAEAARLYGPSVSRA